MGAPISIRTARPEDAERLAAIGAQTFTETFGHLYKEEDLLSFLKKSHSPAAYRPMLKDTNWSVWIAETDKAETAGYAVAGPCGLPVPEMPEKSGELSRLYLLKRHQGAGLGTALLETALAWLEAHFNHIYLSVYAENYGAQRLYQRYGFVKIHDYFYMVGNHSDPEWIMKRR